MSPINQGNQMTRMTLKTEGDRDVIVTRRFAAPPEMVYRAHTDSALIKQWLLGPDGWTMPTCINEARPGGKINYAWTDGQYEWTAGHWERQKAAQAWIPGQWTQGADRWIWVDGHWQ